MVPERPSRRRVLSAGVVAVASLAGCNVLSDEPPDVVVFNRTETAQTATVRLTDAAGEALVSADPTIQAKGAFERDDVLPSSGQVTLSVSVRRGPSGRQTFAVGDAESVQARIDADALQFDRV